MKDFFLNLTRIIESNAKIYWAIIFGIACCLLLYIAEVVHMQSLAEMLKTGAPSISGEVFGTIARRYNLARGLVMVLFILWSVYEYKKTKKKLGL
ncbi:hypothetical protein B9T25_03555 [Acinetobacter sp. ANC 4470]|uniref:hypothetical protein n=1 Tax=Acinetobacter sp. ANC 4470 TaxID=1977881 RepID=UPI000A349982|nr:hypothetical protein B9T25_03555 [Acinetobacter sp. ANC 4470]